MGGSSTISISYTPMVLGPEVLHKVECVGYALGFMSLDDEVSPPGPSGVTATASPGWWAAPSAQGPPVMGLGLRRQNESFQVGGIACRTLPQDP